jgi:hypothetical protein
MARSFLHAALSNDVKGGELLAPGGFGGMRSAPVRKDISQLGLDTGMAKKLWLEAEKLTKTSFVLFRELDFYISPQL